ncbi:uncharacterized protein HPF72_0495, partial [Helicobacter pylori]
SPTTRLKSLKSLIMALNKRAKKLGVKRLIFLMKNLLTSKSKSY